MTIKEFANMRGITVQAVYQKLKTAGVEIASLQKQGSTELTSEGLQKLESLYLKNTSENQLRVDLLKIKEQLEAQKEEARKAQETAAELRNALTREQTTTERLQDALEREQATVEELRKALLEAQEITRQAQITTERLQDALEREQATSEKLHKELEKAQNLHARAQEIEMARVQQSGRGLWARLTGRTKKGDENAGGRVVE
jgi:predicted RNase H-like nuclease (RuvC/YqgF family)